MKRIKQILEAIRHRKFYIIADAKDNSITFSKKLFEHMNVLEQSQAKVYVFKLTNRNPKHYAFMLNPPIEQETQLADVQYNGKYKTIGFESLCPTVSRIFYDYGMPPLKQAKMTVIPRKFGDSYYYEIMSRIW